MLLHNVSFQGVDIHYYPTQAGSMDHVVVELKYNNEAQQNDLRDLAPLFTEKSLIEARDFLYKNNAASIEFNLPEKSFFYGEEITDEIHNLYAKLGTKFGELVASVPTITTVYIDRVAEEKLYPSLQIFKSNLSSKLETSLAHPSVFIQVKKQKLIEGQTPFFCDGVPIYYPVKLTNMQKAYLFFSRIPFLGTLIAFLFGDTERKYLIDSVTKIEDSSEVKIQNIYQNPLMERSQSKTLENPNKPMELTPLPKPTQDSPSNHNKAISNPKTSSVIKTPSVIVESVDPAEDNLNLHTPNISQNLFIKLNETNPQSNPLENPNKPTDQTPLQKPTQDSTSSHQNSNPNALFVSVDLVLVGDETSVDITGIDKATLLMELVNSTNSNGYHARYSQKQITREEAENFLLKNNQQVDYVYGRKLKIDFNDNILDASIYDRDNGGTGTLKNIVERIKNTQSVSFSAN